MQAYAQSFRDLIEREVGLTGEKLLNLHAEGDLKKIHTVFETLLQGIKVITDNISTSESVPSRTSKDRGLNADVVIPHGTRRLMLHNLRNIMGSSRWALFVARFLPDPQESIDSLLDTDKKVEKFVSLTSLTGINSFSYFKECLTEFLNGTEVHIHDVGEWERYGNLLRPNRNMTFSILSQCVLELVENAIKSYYYYRELNDEGEETGPYLDIPAPIGRAKDIHVSLELSETQFICTVKDTGKGIPAQDLPQVFNNHFTQTRGSGFGLFSIRQKLLAAGGCIQVFKNRGNGSTFVIELPVFPKQYMIDNSNQAS